MNRVEQQLGFILKSQAFKETSLIHQIFTRDYGVVSVISKGSRVKNSKHGSLLQPFRSLLLSWVGKSELKTITSAEESNTSMPLKGRSLYCGFYVNELILMLLHKHDSHPLLFKAFEGIILQLVEEDKIESNLRQFEKILFEEIGYALVLDHEAESTLPIKPNMHYNYQFGRGAIACKENDMDAILGSTLINLNLNQLVDKSELNQAKRLMRKLIDSQLDGKILKSRDLFV